MPPCSAARWLAAETSPEELLAGGHFKRLRTMAAARTSNDAETLYLNATVKQLWGALDDAEKLAERAVAANPKDARYHYRLAEISGIKAQRASVLHQMGLARKFKKEAEAALAIDPNHVRALDMMMEFYLQAPGIVGRRQGEGPRRGGPVDEDRSGGGLPGADHAGALREAGEPDGRAAAQIGRGTAGQLRGSYGTRQLVRGTERSSTRRSGTRAKRSAFTRTAPAHMACWP